jgi:hypothetical protein
MVFLHVSNLDQLATNTVGTLGIDLVALCRAVLEPAGIYDEDPHFVLCC